MWITLIPLQQNLPLPANVTLVAASLAVGLGGGVRGSRAFGAWVLQHLSYAQGLCCESIAACCSVFLTVFCPF